MKAFLHWFAHSWRLFKATRRNQYFTCDVCGARSVRKGHPGLQPVNEHWLTTGEWDNPNKPPLAPPGGCDPRLTADLRGYSCEGGTYPMHIDPDEDGDVNDPFRPVYRERR